MRTILHADMDAFYASVEQLDRPELRGQPVIVGGLGHRGVVSAASYEARPFGVHSAMPMVEARRRCPRAVFLPGRMERYVEVSREIRRIFGEFTPEIEPLSVDEAFLDVTASLRLFGSAGEIARRLKERVRSETGLTVSVGIGPTKMVAKIASDLEKPDGLVEVAPEAVPSFLAPLPTSRLWGAGPETRRILDRLGLRTVGAVATASVGRLERHLGSLGRHLHDLANGRDERRVDSHVERRSIGEENTFEHDLIDGDRLRQAILLHADAVARRLRRAERRARTVTLKVRLADKDDRGRYPSRTRSRTLDDPTDDGRTIGDVATGLWNDMKTGLRIRLLGVTASGLEPNAQHQPGLFGDGRRTEALNRALDRIADRHGLDAIGRAGGRIARASPTKSIK